MFILRPDVMSFNSHKPVYVAQVPKLVKGDYIGTDRWPQGTLIRPEMYDMSEEGLGDLGIHKKLKKSVKKVKKVSKKSVKTARKVVKKLKVKRVATGVVTGGTSELIRRTKFGKKLMDKAGKLLVPTTLKQGLTTAGLVAGGVFVAPLIGGTALAVGATTGLAIKQQISAGKTAKQDEEKYEEEMQREADMEQWVGLLNNDPKAFQQAYSDGAIPSRVVAQAKQELGSERWNQIVSRPSIRSGGGSGYGGGAAAMETERVINPETGEMSLVTSHKEGMSPIIPIAIGAAALVMLT